jgi:SPP1 family predicted phage head-tail adaptor
MEIAKLNQRISILEHHTRKDTIGNHKAQWDEVFSCWAAVSVNTSTETNEAGVTKEVVSLEFTVRQTEDTKHINWYKSVYVPTTANGTGTRSTNTKTGE